MAMTKTLAFILTLAALSVIAQPVETEPEFRPDATSLPAGFKAADFRALYKALSIAPKGEFETTAQYDERRKRLPLGVYAFKIELLGPPAYDADAGRFEISILLDFAYRGRERRDGALLVLAHDTESRGSYQASNAFGASVTVQASSTHEWGLLVPGDFGITKLHVPVPVDKAPAVKDRLAVIVVAAIGPENIPEKMTPLGDAAQAEATGYRYKEAKIDSPTEVRTYQHALEAQILGLWVYDTGTGEVFGKFDVRGTPLDAAGKPIPPPAKPKEPLPPARTGGDVMIRSERGMTIEEVRALAAPLVPKITKKGAIEEWKFEDGKLFRFKDGKLENIRMHSKFWLWEPAPK